MKYAALLLFLTSIISVCGGPMLSKAVMQKTDTLVYRYQDASVPPRYHRSYTINVNSTSARLSVDSYGKTLSRASVALEHSEFEDILRMLEQKNIHQCSRKKDRGCTGGTSESLNLLAQGEILFNASVYHCANQDFGDLCGDIGAIAHKLRSLFPEFKEHIQSRYEDDNG